MRKIDRSRLAAVGAGCVVLIAVSATARAADISGVITKTVVLKEDSRLVGDVTCNVTGAACISFGAPHITLLLNGFTMTGQGDAGTGCKGTQVGGEYGILTSSQADIGIRGPGVVQRFQADGILFMGTVKGWVQNVTVTTNCMSGIRINPTSSGISVEANVSVRNGNMNNPCGGI